MVLCRLKIFSGCLKTVDYFEKNNIKFLPGFFHEMYAHPDIAKIQRMASKYCIYDGVNSLNPATDPIDKYLVSLYFNIDDYLPVDRIASEVADPNGQKLYMGGDVDIYYCWLDRYYANYRRY